MENPPQAVPKKFFDKKISEIPCFRDSYLYGISGGIGSWFVYFMFTSKPQMATHLGMATFAVTTLSYWTYCRYWWAEERKTAALLKKFIQDQVITEGTESILPGNDILKESEAVTV